MIFEIIIEGLLQRSAEQTITAKIAVVMTLTINK